MFCTVLLCILSICSLMGSPFLSSNDQTDLLSFHLNSIILASLQIRTYHPVLFKSSILLHFFVIHASLSLALSLQSLLFSLLYIFLLFCNYTLLVSSLLHFLHFVCNPFLISFCFHGILLLLLHQAYNVLYCSLVQYFLLN